MTERNPGGEPNHETLEPSGYDGLYSRLFLASQSGAFLRTTINPVRNIPVDVFKNVDAGPRRNYTKITKTLSSDEREDAWKDVPTFDEQYRQWKEGVVRAVNGLTDSSEDLGRLGALRLIMPGKAAKDFVEADAGDLFKEFCNRDSNTTKFIEIVFSHLSPERINRLLDHQELATFTSNLEWVSRKLFGQKTAEAISRMIELEVKIRNNPEEIKSTIFSDATRVNNLNPDEKEILENLYNGLNKKPGSPGTGSSSRSTRKPFAAEPATQTTQPAETEDEEIREIQASIDAIKRGEAPPFISMEGPKAALRYLYGQLAEAKRRKSATLVVEPKSVPLTPEKVAAIRLEGKDLTKELNTNLLNQANPDVVFSIPVEVLKGYLTSIAGDKLKSSGNIILSKDGNEINIRGLRIDGGFLGGKITLDLLITNSSKGISAQVQNYDGRGMARGVVEAQVATLDSKLKEIASGLVAVQNPVWRPNNIIISGDRIEIGFHNTSVSKGNDPTAPTS